jgi:hypothetical protein
LKISATYKGNEDASKIGKIGSMRLQPQIVSDSGEEIGSA